MQVGSNSFYDASINYSIKLNDKEVLVLEDDELREQKPKTEYEKLQAKEEEKKTKEAKKSSDTELSEDEKRLVLDLQSRDAEVKAHESAHQSGGASTGAATFSYQQGPDGKMYAIGGEVSISVKSGSTPQETIANARAVMSAALAPADPSGQDQAVASSAAMMIAKAEQQIAKEKQSELTGKVVYKNEADKDNASQTGQTPDLEKLDISA